MKKLTTSTGYIAYEATKEEIQSIGGYGICDECGEETEKGYLVPILNHYQCRECFESWSKTARYYPDDVPIQDKRIAYYEHMIPLTNQN